MSMFVCPECRKVFKVKSSNKQIKCPKCPDAILSDLKVSDEEWNKLNADTKKAIIDSNLNTPKEISNTIYIPGGEEDISAEENIKRLEEDAKRIEDRIKKEKPNNPRNMSISHVMGIEDYNYYKSAQNIDAKQNTQNTNTVKCPRCGSTSITTGARGYGGFWMNIGATQTVNRCARCGHTWKPRYR